MNIRSVYETILRNIEDGGGAAAPADTGAPADTPAADTGAEASAPDTGAEPQGNEPPPLEDQLSKIWDNAHKPRDEGGRFKSNREPAEGEEADNDEPNSDDGDGPDEATGAEDGKTTSPQEADGDGPDAATEALPRSWSKDSEAIWKTLPKEAKELLHKRDHDIAQALSRAGNAVKAYRENEPIIRGAEPFRDYLQQREQATGVPSDRLVHDILRFAHGFDTAQGNDAKLDIIAQIADTFGIDFSPWIGPDAADALRTRGGNDPRVDELQRELHELKQSRINERVQEMDRVLGEGLNAFASDKKNYPHFDAVRVSMGRYLGTLDPQDNRPVETLLKEAYDFACLANPTIKQQILRAERARIESEVKGKTQEKTDKATKASATNVNGGVPSPSKRTLEQDIEAAAARFYR